MRATLLFVLSLVLLGVACDGAGTDDGLATHARGPWSQDPSATTPPGSRRPSSPPSALSGGTLLAGHERPGLAYASSPDTDSVDVIDLATHEVVWTALLPVGSEPGRLYEDDEGLVHVALRRSGELATLDFARRSVTRRPACASPRGVAGASGNVFVTCASGELVVLPRAAKSPSRVTPLGRDLRDVVIGGDGFMYITRFRSASLLTVDASTGAVVREVRPNDVDLPLPANGDGAVASTERFEANVAWRARVAPDGSVYVLHQYETTRPLATRAPPSSSVLPYGPVPSDKRCDGRPIIAALTRFEGGLPTGTVLVPFMGPAVDFDFTSTGSVLVAGGGGFGPSAATFTPTFGTGAAPTCAQAQTVSLVRPVVSVAVALGTDLRLVQTRDAASLVAYDTSAFHTGPIQQNAAPPKPAFDVALSASAFDTGFAIFQTPTRAGLACMSCHPEGGDDGHTWRLVIGSDIRKRRTPSLRGGLGETAPFHWDGALSDMGELTTDVFTNRMGGAHLTPAEVGSLADWIDTLPSPAPPRDLDAAAVQRGDAVFHGPAACSKCHNGPHLTNNRTVDVGTGQALQVPSLLGVGARAPFMHDGCAATMHARLTDPTCAGAGHGDLAGLDAASLSDLETFLESL